MRILIFLLFSIQVYGQNLVNPYRFATGPGTDPGAPDAHWDFDNDLDDDINTYTEADGTAVGTMSYSSGDKVEGTHSLDLDGSTNAVLINNSGATDDFMHQANEDITFSGWIKVDTDGTDYIILDEGGQGKGMYLGIGAADVLEFEIDPSSSTEYTGSGSYPTDNGWHHVAFVLDGSASTVIVYLDGSSLFTVNISPDTDFESHNDNGGFGQVHQSIAEFGVSDQARKFDGHFDDFKYWESALTADNILWLYHEHD